MERELRARLCAEGLIFKKDPGAGTAVVSISRMRKLSCTEAASLAEGSFCNNVRCAGCQELPGQCGVKIQAWGFSQICCCLKASLLSLLGLSFFI